MDAVRHHAMSTTAAWIQIHVRRQLPARGSVFYASTDVCLDDSVTRDGIPHTSKPPPLVLFASWLISVSAVDYTDTTTRRTKRAISLRV